MSNTLTHAAPGDRVSLRGATQLLGSRRARLAVALTGIALGVGGLAPDPGGGGEGAGRLGPGVLGYAVVGVRGDSSGHRASRRLDDEK